MYGEIGMPGTIRVGYALGHRGRAPKSLWHVVHNRQSSPHNSADETTNFVTKRVINPPK